MLKGLLGFIAVLFFVLLGNAPVFCGGGPDSPKDRVIAEATMALKGEGIAYAGADILYEEDGGLWAEKVGIEAFENKQPNHGVFKKGLMKHYKVVYFDFKEPVKDVVVFIDADTEKAIMVYRLP